MDRMGLSLLIIILVTQSNHIECLTITSNIQPSSIAPVGNSHVHFSCLFTLQDHERALSIAWLKGSKTFQNIALFFPTDQQQHPIISSSEEGKSFANRSKLSNPSLEYPAATLSVNTIHCDDEGIYRCMITFLDLSGTKNEHRDVYLTTTAPGDRPSVLTVPFKNFGYEEGHTITFTCTANVGKPLGNILWWINRNGSFVTVTPTREDTQKTSSTIPTVKPGVCIYNVTSHLTIILRKEDNGAIIRCTVDQLLLGSQSPVDKPNKQTNPLNVYFKIGKPHITVQPNSARYPVGMQQLTLQCTVTGNPNPATSDDFAMNKFIWYYSSDQEDTILASSVDRITVSRGTLTITDLARYHQGRYICMAQNGFNDKVYINKNAIFVSIVSPTTATISALDTSTAIQRKVRDADTHRHVLNIGIPVAVVALTVTLVVLCWVRRKKRQSIIRHPDEIKLKHENFCISDEPEKPQCPHARGHTQSINGENAYTSFPTKETIRDNVHSEPKSEKRHLNCKEENQTETVQRENPPAEVKNQQHPLRPRDSEIEIIKRDNAHIKLKNKKQPLDCKEESGNETIQRENAFISFPARIPVRDNELSEPPKEKRRLHRNEESQTEIIQSENPYDTIPADREDTRLDQED